MSLIYIFGESNLRASRPEWASDASDRILEALCFKLDSKKSSHLAPRSYPYFLQYPSVPISTSSAFAYILITAGNMRRLIAPVEEVGRARGEATFGKVERRIDKEVCEGNIKNDLRDCIISLSIWVKTRIRQ
ncbi:hypothetical protein I352_04842 [Cryptococcus deuterogattii MMRL2647]|nr:hypothetical protein I352_04842 [Cryptococcus deuterogattii MMRL2647]